MSSYPLQGSKTHSEMTVATSLPLFTQSLAHARAAGQGSNVAGDKASFGKLLARIKYIMQRINQCHLSCGLLLFLFSREKPT